MRVIESRRGREPSALEIEARGIGYVPLSERRGKPADIGWMWAGTGFSVSPVIFGAIVLAMGLSFLQAVVVIVVGNLSWYLVGLASRSGPAAGTTAFAISRACFGRDGNRPIGLLNWLMMLGYEVFGVSTMILAILAVLSKFGVHSNSNGLRVALVFGFVVLQTVVPFFGHKLVVTILKWAVVPFAALFIILAVLTVHEAHLSTGHSANLATVLVALALVGSGSGYSYTVNASDYTRYLPPDTHRRRLIWAASLGGFVPTTLLMLLGATVATGLSGASDPISGLPHAFPGWFLVPYLICVIATLCAGGGIVQYSSGVTLQAVGVPVSRVQAMLVDAVCCVIVAILVTLFAGFDAFVSDFLLFMIVWFAPWTAIFLIDYKLRHGKYDHDALVGHAKGTRPPKGRDISLAGVTAQVLGMAASAAWLDTSIWKGPLSSATAGSDLSMFTGFIVAGVVYYALKRRELARGASLVPAPTTRDQDESVVLNAGRVG